MLSEQEAKDSFWNMQEHPTLLLSEESILLEPNLLDGEGSGIQLQYSRLENPMDGGAW